MPVVHRKLAYGSVVGLVVAMACNSGNPAGRTDYFTFVLQNFPMGQDTVDAYLYVPWSPEERVLTMDPCYLVEFDLHGRAVRQIGTVRTDDTVDQPEAGQGSYVHYLGDANGEFNSSCDRTLDGRFGFGGDVFTLVGTRLRIAFPDPKSQETNQVPYNEAGYWLLEGTTVHGLVYFFPYEYSPGTPSTVISPTEPGGD